MGRLILTLLLLLLTATAQADHGRRPPRVATTVPACTHFAAPTGAGAACTREAPCLVGTWLSASTLAVGGHVLCLQAGVYRGPQSMIDPPDTTSGQAGSPITVRAETDGAVLVDGEHARDPVFLTPTNQYWEIWGLNAANGVNDVIRLGQHSRAYRVIGWNGTAGQADSTILELGRGVDNLFIDSAGFGTDSRKILNGSQSQGPDQASAWSGFRRVWAQWGSHPMGSSRPSNTAQVGYQTRQQRLENVLLTWDTAAGGATDRPEGALEAFIDCDGSMSNAAHGTAVLGSLAYLRPGARFPGDKLVQAYCASGMTWTDVASLLGGGFAGVRPFYFPDFGSGGATTGNTCTNCLAVHNGRPSENQAPGSGWTLPGFREGATLAEATGGVSLFTLLPGLCTRYEGGTRTTQPLWPWPMNERIKAATAQAGLPPVDVTAEVEALLGPIPDACRWDRTPVPPQPEPPQPGALVLTCTGTVRAVPGAAHLTCTQQLRR